jgi:restriction endonuclease S subunit
LNSDKLWDFANANAAGTMSKRVKWRDLGNYEILLPPKEQQISLADLLWAGNNVVEKFTDLEKTIVKCISNYIDNELFYSKTKKELRKKQKLIDYCVSKPKYGANAASKPYVLNSPRYIRITDINDDGRLIETGIVSIDSDNYEDYLLHEGDFLFARTGNTVGKTFLFRNSDGISVYAGYLIKFSLDIKKLKPEILEIFCKSTTYQRFLKSVVKVGAQPNINAEQYSNLEIPIISIDEQNKILKQYSYLNNSLVVTRKNLNSMKQIQKQLINQIFG